MIAELSGLFKNSKLYGIKKLKRRVHEDDIAESLFVGSVSKFLTVNILTCPSNLWVGILNYPYN